MASIIIKVYIIRQNETFEKQQRNYYFINIKCWVFWYVAQQKLDKIQQLLSIILFTVISDQYIAHRTTLC